MLLKSTQTLFVSETQNVYHSPLPRAIEESVYEDKRADERSPGGTSSSAHHRHSVATTVSDNTHEWFDAVDQFDGPEEFVMELQSAPEGGEQPSHILSNDSRSSLERPEQYSTEIDKKEERELEVPLEPKLDARALVRRTHLPSPVVGDEGSLFAILKKNVGKVIATSLIIVSRCP